MSQPTPSERLGIAGSGAIACGLARVAGEATLWARSDASAERARSKVPETVELTTALRDLAGCRIVVEAVAEELDVKRPLLADLGELLGPRSLLATSTSSLPVSALAEASGRPEQFAALHVFNPVHKMDLVELAFPEQAADETRERMRALCRSIGKTAVEVPPVPGFVVNRLLFPFLFSAVELMQAQSLDPEAVDTCMKLGAAHPIGPLALLDLVGLDVSAAIGDAIGAEVPQRLRDLVAAGNLGRKSGAGFYSY
ncbi:MAG: 3-hydroxyacyl-CoA dehydrogenase family protein [Actinomycetota bacterium]|nr:3-hydroxyacyl-CoA dehydrogenase family protein [Actinomycetota bacterium]MDQ3720952.1 3-hydroxyacyl-CoA dehydrogenase family protein [Actinomycetota bacterium]